MVDAIGIIPENSEILGSRSQSGQTAHRLIGVGNSAWVGVLGNTPDSLDGLVLCNQLLHQLHIRAFLVHRNIDHLNVKVFCNCKMSVISRNRTEELHLVKLAPGSASHNTVCHGAGNGIIHYI